MTTLSDKQHGNPGADPGVHEGNYELHHCRTLEYHLNALLSPNGSPGKDKRHIEDLIGLRRKLSPVGSITSLAVALKRYARYSRNQSTSASNLTLSELFNYLPCKTNHMRIRTAKLLIDSKQLALARTILHPVKHPPAGYNSEELNAWGLAQFRLGNYSKAADTLINTFTASSFAAPDLAKALLGLWRVERAEEILKTSTLERPIIPLLLFLTQVLQGRHPTREEVSQIIEPIKMTERQKGFLAMIYRESGFIKECLDLINISDTDPLLLINSAIALKCANREQESLRVLHSLPSSHNMRRECSWPDASAAKTMASCIFDQTERITPEFDLIQNLVEMRLRFPHGCIRKHLANWYRLNLARWRMLPGGEYLEDSPSFLSPQTSSSAN